MRILREYEFTIMKHFELYRLSHFQLILHFCGWVIMGFASCKDSTEKIQVLQYQIDSLKQQLAETYKPGFGEFMNSLQQHHEKLWFAGQNENWKLAAFELQELQEVASDIEKYQTQRAESKLITMIKPALDSLDQSVQEANKTKFINQYHFLTNSCNRCHQTTQFEFNVVKIPETNKFSNQDFSKYQR